MTFYLVLFIVGLVAGYEVLVRVQMAKTPAIRYNAVFARVLRFILPPNMRCLSLWRTA